MTPTGGEGTVAAQVERRDLSGLGRAVVVFLVLFLLVFPKGGIKTGGVPITWGYLGLFAASAAFPLAMLRGGSAAFPRVRLAALGALVPFQLLVCGSFLVHGFTSATWAVALTIVLFFLPLLFVLGFAPGLERVDLAWLLRLVRGGIFAIAVYGIFLFFFKATTGRFIEIPFLTVNQGDLGGLDSKMIDRGSAFKLISTYNNGNVYGISLLILLPLYTWMERSPLRTGTVKLSLLLSLSRTVWIGMLVSELLQRLYVRRPTVRTLVVLALSMGVLVGGVLYAVTEVLQMDPVRFLFDRNLGGRISQFDEVGSVTLLPGRPFGIVWEMVYLSILGQFGLLGLAAFVVAFAAPVALQLLGCTPQAGTAYKRSLAAGIATWLVVAMGDGGMLVIPIMAFFWFAVSLLLSDNPTWAGILAPPRSGAPAASGPAIVE